MSKLTWRHDTMGYSGVVLVAHIADMNDAVESVPKGWYWELYGLRTKWLKFKTYGTLKTRGGAQRAAQRAWDQWLESAGVVENALFKGHSEVQGQECPTNEASDARS